MKHSLSRLIKGPIRKVSVGRSWVERLLTWMHRARGLTPTTKGDHLLNSQESSTNLPKTPGLQGSSWDPLFPAWLSRLEKKGASLARRSHVTVGMHLPEMECVLAIQLNLALNTLSPK